MVHPCVSPLSPSLVGVLDQMLSWRLSDEPYTAEELDAMKEREAERRKQSSGDDGDENDMEHRKKVKATIYLGTHVFAIYTRNTGARPCSGTQLVLTNTW